MKCQEACKSLEIILQDVDKNKGILSPTQTIIYRNLKNLLEN